MIVVDDNIPLLAPVLQQLDDVLSLPHKHITNELLKQQNCTALFVRSTLKVDEELLHDTQVEFVSTATSGIDHVDTTYLQDNGIAFFSAHGTNATSVAEYVVYCILQWQSISGCAFDRCTVGIIGVGEVGTRVALILKSIGIHTLVYDPPRTERGDIVVEYGEVATFNTILSTANIITNHVPFTDIGTYPTNNLIDKHSLESWSKPDLCIHTSRGGIVDENALLQLIEKRGTSVAIDTWINEPNSLNTDLLLSAMIATPHIAGHSMNAKLNGSLHVAEEFARFKNTTIETSAITSILKQHTAPFHGTPILKDLYKSNVLLDMIESQRKLSSISNHLKKHYPASHDIFSQVRREYNNHWETIQDPTLR